MERKEPTLSSTAIDHDELLSPRPKTAGAKASSVAPSRERDAKVAKPRPAPVYQPKPASNWLAGLALLVAVAATAGSGYLAWKLEQTEQVLLAADSRIQELEQRLTFTDEESSQSVEAIRAKLKWADAEIRKLWGVSYDTNRKSIKTNQDKLARVSKQANSAAKTSQSNRKLVNAQQSKLQAVEKSSNTDSERLEGMISSFEQQRERLRDAVDKANKANLELTRIRKDFSSRVKSNEEAIEAIDAYRVRINRELNELKQRSGLQ